MKIAVSFEAQINVRKAFMIYCEKDARIATIAIDPKSKVISLVKVELYKNKPKLWFLGTRWKNWKN